MNLTTPSSSMCHRSERTWLVCVFNDRALLSSCGGSADFLSLTGHITACALVTTEHNLTSHQHREYKPVDVLSMAYAWRQLWIKCFTEGGRTKPTDSFWSVVTCLQYNFSLLLVTHVVKMPPRTCAALARVTLSDAQPTLGLYEISFYFSSFLNC